MDQPISLDTVVNFLVSTPLFGGLDAAERAEVVRAMDVQRLTDGEDVFHEGDPGDAWYVIFQGAARVLQDSGEGYQELAVLESGACFGEMAILDSEGRSATIRALGPLTVFRFRRSNFEQLLNQGSLGAYKLVLAMARMLSRRHRKLTHQLTALLANETSATDEREESETAAGRAAVATYQISE